MITKLRGQEIFVALAGVCLLVISSMSIVNMVMNAMGRIPVNMEKFPFAPVRAPATASTPQS